MSEKAAGADMLEKWKTRETRGKRRGDGEVKVMGNKG
jgi:hypothetical protein